MNNQENSTNLPKEVKVRPVWGRVRHYCGSHQVCNEKVKWILENHKPEPLPDDVLANLEEIAQAATDPETLAVGKTAKAKRRRKFRVA